ncbi:MAG: DNA-processing protein DprA [bacterium]|nr:DNA-processing protein DprA [bacterium]
MDENHFYLIALLSADGIGPKRAKTLIDFFGTPQKALQGTSKDWLQVTDIGENIAKALYQKEKLFQEAEKILQFCVKNNIHILTLEDADYPNLLKEIHDPPLLLYQKGTLKPVWEKSISIVGTRLATEYGKKVANQFAKELSCNGWTVVSGLAIGIDGAAHKGALAGGVGSTVGVLGCGINVYYPPQHKNLTEAIVEQGLLLSEYPPNVQPDARYFPQRNRIISGLTKGTVVIEAGDHSGALITSELAIEQNRDVFAVPGMITSPYSKGTNQLIQKGAKLVTSVNDILNEYEPYNHLPKADPNQLENLSTEEKKLFEELAYGPFSADILAEKLNWDIGNVLSVLTTLQLKGLLVNMAGEYHRTVRD